MPAQEEVDEINEFLQKRREKQRLGELPRDDATPGFAKKISLAVFGKPRVEKIPIQSTQPTVASTQAQAAMRQQLDEIMDAHLSAAAPSRSPSVVPKATPISPRPAFTSSTPSNQPPRTPSPPKPAPTASPRVPNYYANMPYPPYIQRGLATLPTASPTAAQAAGLSSARTPPAPRPISPAPTRTPTTPMVSKSPAANASPLSPKPATAPVLNPARPLPSQVSPVPRTTPILSMSPQKAAPTRPLSPSASPAPRMMSPYGATSSSASTLAAAAPASKQSFWKKLFGGKQKPSATPTPSPVMKTNTPSPYSPALRTTPLPASRAPIEPIQPITHATVTNSSPREKSLDISPVNTKQTPPATARDEITSIAREKSMVPALSPPTPTIIPEKSPAPSFSTSRVGEASEIKKEFSPTMVAPAQSFEKNETKNSETKKMDSVPRSQPTTMPPAGKSAPYVPPWVARNASVTPAPLAPSSASSPATRETMPWKQPFGTPAGEDFAPVREKINSTIEKSPLPHPDPIVSRAKKNDDIRLEDADEYAAPASPAQSSGMEKAMEQEISEEEALESLPFEDVEGLSASDLDYLSQKEKEHRKAQEEKDSDVGIPSELKNTLQRQSTQLEGALTPNSQITKNPTNDEKQEILRRLKQMMDEEGHR